MAKMEQLISDAVAKEQNWFWEAPGMSSEAYFFSPRCCDQ